MNGSLAADSTIPRQIRPMLIAATSSEMVVTAGLQFLYPGQVVGLAGTDAPK